MILCGEDGYTTRTTRPAAPPQAGAGDAPTGPIEETESPSVTPTPATNGAATRWQFGKTTHPRHARPMRRQPHAPPVLDINIRTLRNKLNEYRSRRIRRSIPMLEENSPQLTDLLQQAQAARLANQLDHAARLLGAAFEKYPDALPVAKELALLHQQRGEWPEAAIASS